MVVELRRRRPASRPQPGHARAGLVRRCLPPCGCARDVAGARARSTHTPRSRTFPGNRAGARRRRPRRRRCGPAFEPARGRRRLQHQPVQRARAHVRLRPRAPLEAGHGHGPRRPWRVEAWTDVVVGGGLAVGVERDSPLSAPRRRGCRIMRANPGVAQALMRANARALPSRRGRDAAHRVLALLRARFLLGLAVGPRIATRREARSRRSRSSSPRADRVGSRQPPHARFRRFASLALSSNARRASRFRFSRLDFGSRVSGARHGRRRPGEARRGNARGRRASRSAWSALPGC